MLIPLLSLLLTLFCYAQNPDTVKVGYIQTPPLVYKGLDDNLTGITYDLVQSFLKEADIFHVTYVPFSDKKSAAEALQTGDIHIFLGNLGDSAQTNIVTTKPYMIDGVYALPRPQNFTNRLTNAINWQDLAISTSIFFIVTSSLCAFLLVMFDTHLHKHPRLQSRSAVFFSQLYTLFSSFSRNLISAPLSTAGRVITATWTVLVSLYMVFLTSVVTCAVILALSPSKQPTLSLGEISGQRVGLLDDAFGTAYAFSTTSTLHTFSNTHDLIAALEDDTIDYAVVSGAFFAHTLSHIPHTRATGLADMPLTLNPQAIALNKDFAHSVLFSEKKITYAEYFDEAIDRDLHSLSLYYLCTRYIKNPYACVF